MENLEIERKYTINSKDDFLEVVRYLKAQTEYDTSDTGEVSKHLDYYFDTDSCDLKNNHMTLRARTDMDGHATKLTIKKQVDEYDSSKNTKRIEYNINIEEPKIDEYIHFILSNIECIKAADEISLKVVIMKNSISGIIKKDDVAFEMSFDTLDYLTVDYLSHKDSVSLATEFQLEVELKSDESGIDVMNEFLSKLEMNVPCLKECPDESKYVRGLKILSEINKEIK